MPRIILWVVTGALAAAAALAAELPPFEQYICEGGMFRARVPSGWTPAAGSAPYADRTRVAGEKFQGPATAEGVPASVALTWYSGEKSFTTPQSFINARLGSLVREDSDRGAATEEVTIAGRKATAFTMTTFELLWKHDLSSPGGPKEDRPYIYERRAPSVTVTVEERYLVLPASKGYYVLHYRAPAGTVERYQAIFDAVTASFEPLL